MTTEDAACPSGLLGSARELPDEVEAICATDESAGGWLDWLGHEGAGLVWPS